MKSLFDFQYMLKAITKISEALPLTMLMLVLVMLLGLIVGFLLAAMRIKGNKLLKGIATVYVSFARGTPELVQLLLVYYMLPELLEAMGIETSSWNKVIFAIIAFSLSNAAYLSETLRAAYMAVPKGQHEAAASIGMTERQAFRRIILPQTVLVALPNISNTIVVVLKNLSIGFSIGIMEILGKTKLLSAAGFGAKNLECYMAAAIIYYAICLVLERLLKYLERLFQKGKKEYA